MDFDLSLLLALLGGYWFIHLSFFYRFRAQTLTGYRLVFEAALVGFGFVALAFLVRFFFRDGEVGSCVAQVWSEVAGPGAEVLGVLVLALLLVPPAAWLSNVFEGLRELSRVPELWDDSFPTHQDLLQASYNHALDKALHRSGNELSLLFHAAALSQQTVNLTLRNGKVYVGWIKRSPGLKPDEQYVRLAPLMSGYRKEESHEVFFNIDYPSDEYEDARSPIELEEFEVILPVAEIVSARLFDFDVYERHFAAASSSEPTPTVGGRGGPRGSYPFRA